jgi:hypothetical protein
LRVEAVGSCCSGVTCGVGSCVVVELTSGVDKQKKARRFRDEP